MIVIIYRQVFPVTISLSIAILIIYLRHFDTDIAIIDIRRGLKISKISGLDVRPANAQVSLTFVPP